MEIERTEYSDTIFLLKRQDFTSPETKYKEGVVTGRFLGFYRDSAVFVLENESNSASRYGYSYMRKSRFLDNYMKGLETTMEKQNDNYKNFKYLVKFSKEVNEFYDCFIFTNIEYNIGNTFVYRDNSGTYNIGHIKEIFAVEDITEEFKKENLCHHNLITKGYIVSLITDNKKVIENELEDIQNEIDQINNHLQKYLLILLTGEKLPKELELEKEKLIELLKQETKYREKLNNLKF